MGFDGKELVFSWGVKCPETPNLTRGKGGFGEDGFEAGGDGGVDVVGHGRNTVGVG